MKRLTTKNVTWSGRIDPDAMRLHEAVNLTDFPTYKKESTRGSFTFVGFASDEGVRRNKGRLGAKEAPLTVRKHLASLPHHFQSKLYDVGNVHCDDGQLEKAQETLGETVATILRQKSTPVIIGGGHETLYGHYLGVREALGPDAVIGIINIDAHFDLRKADEATSGTMFRQILTNDENARYLCLGIQTLGNTSILFNTADQLGVEYVLREDVERLAHTEQVIESFSEKCDAIMMTLCMDVVRQADAPGVSAPAPFGLDSQTVRSLMQTVAQRQNFVSFDISEVNPTYDRDDQTSRLASYLIGQTLLTIERGDRS